MRFIYEFTDLAALQGLCLQRLGILPDEVWDVSILDVTAHTRHGNLLFSTAETDLPENRCRLGLCVHSEDLLALEIRLAYQPGWQYRRRFAVVTLPVWELCFSQGIHFSPVAITLAPQGTACALFDGPAQMELPGLPRTDPDLYILDTSSPVQPELAALPLSS